MDTAPRLIVDVGGRQSGKTTRLLEWLKAAPPGEHRVLVSASASRAMDLLHEALELGYELESWQFVGAEEVSARAWSGVLAGRGGWIVLGIDDLDAILPTLFAGWPIGRVSVTGTLVERIHGIAFE